MVGGASISGAIGGAASSAGSVIGSGKDSRAAVPPSWGGAAHGAPGIAAEGVPCNVEQRLRKSIRDGWVGLASGLHGGRMLRECFDQSHAERPDIGGRGKRRDGRFGSIVSVKLVRWFAGFADGGERVAGQLELIGGG